jgi:hypothetical protein
MCSLFGTVCSKKTHYHHCFLTVFWKRHQKSARKQRGVSDWMGPVSFWSMLIMLKYWAKPSIPQRKRISIKCNEVNAQKTKHCTCSRLVTDYTTNQLYSTKVANKSSENVAQFWYFGITVTNQNSIHEGITTRIIHKMLATTVLFKSSVLMSAI